MNLGEEQSIGSIVCLSWSHVGLAKHKRSALAILTTNHVLSLWASSSDPKVALSWERVLVVNTAFNAQPDDGLSANPDGEVYANTLKQSKRIRSMSWATPEVESFHRDAGTINQGQLLAVTDDADGVAILQITSPWSRNEQPSWDARIQCRNQWESLIDPLSACDRSTAAEKDCCQTAAIGRAQQWPSRFAASLAENSFVESVACFSFSDFYRGLRLILRKSWQVLQIEISLDSLSQTFTNKSWMPISLSDPSEVQCPSFISTPTVCLAKTFPTSSHCTGHDDYDACGRHLEPLSHAVLTGKDTIRCFSWKNSQILSNEGRATVNPRVQSRILHFSDRWDEISGQCSRSHKAKAMTVSNTLKDLPCRRLAKVKLRLCTSADCFPAFTH